MIWAVLFQGLTCSALCGTIVFLERSHSRERTRLVNLLISPNTAAFATLQRASGEPPVHSKARPNAESPIMVPLPEGL